MMDCDPYKLCVSFDNDPPIIIHFDERGLAPVTVLELEATENFSAKCHTVSHITFTMKFPN